MQQSTTPPVTDRIRFKTQLDWTNYLASGNLTGLDLYATRAGVYKDIEKLRGRPLLIYASNFLSPFGGIPGVNNSILLDDVDGFTDLISTISLEVEDVDVLLHSPGGSPDATERIVSILRKRFKRIHFLIPHSAYSAATMLSLAGDSITLHPSATLGPIDPQLNGIPARSIIRGFENVRESIVKDGPEALPAYIPLIEKYTLAQLEQCKDAADLSKELVRNWLKQYMFEGKGDDGIINDAVDYFSDYDEHKTHSRPLLFEKIKSFGLKIEESSGELTNLLRETYILLNGFFEVMQFGKLYENINGFSFGKQFAISPPAQP